MKIDKFGIYKKMRQANPGIGLTRKIKAILNKKIYFSVENNWCHDQCGLVTGLKFNESEISIYTSLSGMNKIEWSEHLGWRFYSKKDFVDLQSKKITEIKFF